jgi:cephalosporin-C deacetylase-like acetyl esterase
VTKDGFAAVGFVSALTGHRYQNRPMKQWFVSELPEALGSSVHDVQMILNYLSTRNDLDISKVGMFGEGSGGTIAILAATADPRIKTLDLLDPWGDWPDWMAKSDLIPDEERPDYLKPEFLRRAAALDPTQWLAHLTSQHIRIQQVMDDSVTPRAAQERIESAAPRTAQIVRYDNTRDFFSAVSGGRIFQWVKEQLQPAPLKQPSIQASQKPSVRAIESGRD